MTTVLYVSGTPGSYKAGDSIPITIKFSAATVTASGSPKLQMMGELGGTYATFTSAASDSATFTYTVTAGDNTNYLDYYSSSALDYTSGNLSVGGVIFPSANALPEPGSANSLSGQSSIVIDTIAPTVVLESTTSYLASSGTAAVTASFSEAVTAVNTSLITVVNGTFVSATDNLCPDEKIITAVSTSTSPMTITIGASAFADVAGNLNASSNTVEIGIDTSPPTLSAAPTGHSLYAIAGHCRWYWHSSGATDDSGYVAGYIYEIKDASTSTVVSSGDIGLSYGVSYDGSDGHSYTCRIQAYDLAGNKSSWSSWGTSVTVDTARPAPTITCSATAAPTNSSSITAMIDFGETVYDFSEDNVELTNLIRAGVTGGPSSYVLTLHPKVHGTCSIRVPEAIVYDVAGNTNEASDTTTFTYDIAKPTCSVSCLSSMVTSPIINFTIAFSEEVVGFTTSDISLVNCAGGSLSSSGNTYTYTVTANTPSAGETTQASCFISGGVVTDEAGNTSYASNVCTVTYDPNIPTVENVTSLSEDGTYYVGDKIDIQVEFSKPVIVKGGIPTLKITNSIWAKYISGSGTDTLIFLFTVPANITISDLNYYSTTALVKNGAYIKDTAGNDAVLTLPGLTAAGSLGTNKNIIISSASAPTSPSFEDACGTSSMTVAQSVLTSPNNYIRSGIGYGDDLKVALEMVHVSGNGNRWYPTLHKGWFYDRDVERYLYAERNSIYSTNTSSAVEDVWLGYGAEPLNALLTLTNGSSTATLQSSSMIPSIYIGDVIGDAAEIPNIYVVGYNRLLAVVSENVYSNSVYTTTVTLRTAYTGTTKTIQAYRQVSADYENLRTITTFTSGASSLTYPEASKIRVGDYVGCSYSSAIGWRLVTAVSGDTVTFTPAYTGATTAIYFSRKRPVTGIVSDIDASEVHNYGPVLLSSTGLEFVEVSSPLRTMVTCSPSTAVSGEVDRYSFTLIGLPVELYRQDLRTPMHRVQTVAGIVNTSEYSVDSAVVTSSSGLNVVHTVTVAGTSAVYATTVTPESDADYLKQCEICTVDSAGRIRASYASVATTDSAKYPIITFLKDGVLTTASASSVNGTWLNNILTFDLAETTVCAAGDRVALEYYVDNSYAIDKSGYLHWYSTSTEAAVTIDFEASEEDYWAGAKNYDKTTGVYSESCLQLNPLYSAISPGFVYIKDTNEPVHSSYSVDFAASPTYTYVNTGTNQNNSSQPVRLRVRVSDDAGNPVTNAPVALGFSSSYGAIDDVTPSTYRTNWQGELDAIWRPSAVGTVIVTATVTLPTSATITKTATIVHRDYQLAVASIKSASPGKLYLVITDESRISGTNKVVAYLTTSDGSFPCLKYGIEFISRNSTFSDAQYTLEGYSTNAVFSSTSYASTAVACNKVYTDINGLAENDYYTSDNDVIFAVCKLSTGECIFSNFITVDG